ncbi:hypothetical protein ACVWZZ_003937 [Bradyrhizobium sp. LM6.10]
MVRSTVEKPVSSGVVGVEHDLKVVAHRTRLPAEQGPDGAQQPALCARAHHLA